MGHATGAPDVQLLDLVHADDLPFEDPVDRRRAAVLRVFLLAAPLAAFPYTVLFLRLELWGIAAALWIGLAPLVLAGRSLANGRLGLAAHLFCGSVAAVVVLTTWMTGGPQQGPSPIWLAVVVWIAALTQRGFGAGAWFVVVGGLWVGLAVVPSPAVPPTLEPWLDVFALFSSVCFIALIGGLAVGAGAVADDLTARSSEAEGAALVANAEKDQFLAAMSHQLRTPLTTVVGYTEAIAEDASTEGREPEMADLDRIGLASRGLLAILDDILDLASLSSGEVPVNPGPLDLRDLEAELRATIEPLAERRGNVFVVEVTPPAVIPWLDGGRIRQVLVNLLGNACKFTEEGQILLRIAPKPDHRLVFEVEDSGIGMSAEQQARVFRAFEQATAQTVEKYGGTGLGLAICERLVGAMGGRIQVESALGEGTRFFFDLPAGKPASAQARRVA